jgi:site-specific DNA-methyltransferase (adenine-specific)
LTCAIEDAGWEIVDKVMWLYGSGFPSGYNISKGLDKAKNKEGEREVVGRAEGAGSTNTEARGDFAPEYDETKPATNLAKRFEGYKTQLKPAWEPVVVAMQPRVGTYADNVAKHDVAGFNIDGCRVGVDGSRPNRDVAPHNNNRNAYNLSSGSKANGETTEDRFPANLITSPQVRDDLEPQGHDDNGDFYFYCPKASRPEREAGLADGDDRANQHPTVKPLDLCRYLAKLILPPERTDGTRDLLVPFSGSGSEMIGALTAGWDTAHGIEQQAEYVDIAHRRIDHWTSESDVEVEGEQGALL